MVRNWFRMFAMVAIVAMIGLVVSPAMAQRQGGRQGGGFGGGFGGQSDLAKLVRADVRAALDLDADQVEKATAAQTAWQEEFGFGGGGRGGRRGGADGAEFNLEEFQAAQKKGRDAATAKVKEILLPQQAKRFEQISLQIDMAGGGFGGGGGGGAFGGPGGGFGGGGGNAGGLLVPRVVELLSITEEQQEKMRGMTEAINKVRDEKIAKANEEARKEYMASLTPDQQKKLTDAIGEKFEMQAGGGGGGRGGRGGAGGRGGRGNRGNQN